jgi:hypothetical protein
MKCQLTTLQEKKRVLETTPEERIAQLEFARNDLIAKKQEMELQIAKYRESVKAEEQAKEQAQVKPPK